MGFLLWVQGRRRRVPDLLSPVRQAGYEVVAVTSGRQALRVLETHEKPPDLVVLYLASLGSSGNRLTTTLRTQLPDIPLFLILPEAPRPREHKQDPLTLRLHLPLRPERFLRRLRRWVRPPTEPVTWSRIGPIWYDEHSLRIRVGNREQMLTPLTFRLLLYLLRNAGRVVSHEELYRAVWGTPSNGDLRTLHVHICWLRKALEKDPKRPRWLRTVRGQGYLWVRTQKNRNSRTVRPVHLLPASAPNKRLKPVGKPPTAPPGERQPSSGPPPALYTFLYDPPVSWNPSPSEKEKSVPDPFEDAEGKTTATSRPTFVALSPEKHRTFRPSCFLVTWEIGPPTGNRDHMWTTSFNQVR